MSENKTKTGRAVKKLFAVIVSIALIAGMMQIIPASASGKPGAQTRTIMLYLMGANLETYWENGTWNLVQAMAADYDENINFIVMTGAAEQWHTPAEYLVGADAIDPEFNQLWKLEGKRENEDHGVMRLLGTIKDFEKVSMAQSSTMTAFMDYCCENFPADLYDIILWDHGGGYVGGFGYDERFKMDMGTAQLLSAFNEAKLIKEGKKFEIIDFDACEMATVEITAAISPYADYLVASAESEPGFGQEYTSWLNALQQNPNMNGFELGKQIVDALVAFYSSDSEYSAEATLSVINIKNFMERLFPVLNELDDIIISEAKNVGKLNNRYNFYDEIYSISSAFKYVSGTTSEYDLGTLAGVLSAPQSEFDNCTDPDINERKNAYTEVALRILSVLGDRDGSDDDVIYEGESDSTSQAISAYVIRGLDGEFLEPDEDGYIRVKPTGLGFLFGDSRLLYAAAMANKAKDSLSVINDGAVLDYIKKRSAVMAYYSLIFNVGAIVSELSENGVKYVSWRNVSDYIKQDKNVQFYIDLIFQNLVRIGEFETEDEITDYLSQIVTQQAMEALRFDKITVRRIVEADGNSNYYQVVISNASSQSLMTVKSAAAIASNDYSNDVFDLIFKKIYGDRDFDEVFPRGIFCVSAEYEGTLDTNYYYENYTEEISDIYQRLYSSSSTVWLVPQMKAYCFALFDAEGNLYPAQINYTDRSKTKGYVPIQLLFPAEGSLLDAFIYIYLEDGVWKVSGVSLASDTADRSYIPMDSSYFSGAQFATETLIADADGSLCNLPMSRFADIDTSLDKWGLSFGWVDADEAAEFGEVWPYYAVTDIYDNEIDITKLFEAADKTAEEGNVVYTIDCTEITVAEATYNGQMQKPEVTVKMGDRTLTESIDYVVLYNGSVLPGRAYIAVLGIGDFTDAIYIPYDIQCAVHVLSHIDANKATPDHPGNAECWRCDYCGKFFSDENGEHEVAEEELIIEYRRTAGDINGDGNVNNKDLTRLFQYLSGWKVTVDETVLDVNGDGESNNKDLTRLFQYLSNWNVKIF